MASPGHGWCRWKPIGRGGSPGCFGVSCSFPPSMCFSPLYRLRSSTPSKLRCPLDGPLAPAGHPCPALVVGGTREALHPRAGGLPLSSALVIEHPPRLGGALTTGTRPGSVDGRGGLMQNHPASPAALSVVDRPRRQALALRKSWGSSSSIRRRAHPATPGWREGTGLAVQAIDSSHSTSAMPRKSLSMVCSLAC